MKKWREKALMGHVVGKTPWYPIESVMPDHHSKVVGCKPFEVTAMNTLTVNIHFAFVSIFTSDGKLRNLCKCGYANVAI